ncbi:hypothetical protein HDU67_000860 [Dinochytrium kinnereticum]|nr:hypothetical protein HDU67_000860 [Dinochytrium kinnereticum]
MPGVNQVDIDGENDTVLRDEEIDQEEEEEESAMAGEFGVSLPSVPCPPDRPENIHSIVETVDRYNPENLPMLEDYVREQMLNNTIDRTANLAVLKLYQFNPTLTNIPVVVSILALSLAALPDPDVNLSLCLLSEEILKEPAVERLVEMQHLLERCQFQQFWEVLDSETAAADEGEEGRLNLLRDYPEFDTCIRKFISSTLASAYHSISVSLLQVYLNLEGEDLADWISVIGATFNSESSDLVDFPTAKESVTKPIIVQENIRFEQLTKIIGVGRLSTA